MILYKGEVYGGEHTAKLLQTLRADADETLLHKRIDREKLISSADIISKRIKAGEYNCLLSEIDVDGIDEYIEKAAEMLKRENLLLNIKASLPSLIDLPDIVQYIAPVGVLFHIAAGDHHGLAAEPVLVLAVVDARGALGKDQYNALPD